MSDSFQILRGSSIRLSSRRVCSSGLTSSQYFTRMIPESTIAFSTRGHLLEEAPSLSSSVQKPMTRSTPARLYQLRSKMTTSPAGGEVRDVALHVHLRLLALGRCGQRHDPEHPGADPLGDRLDRAALAGGVAALEHDADLGAGRLHPLLHRDELAVQSRAARAGTPSSSSWRRARRSPIVGDAARRRCGRRVGGTRDRRRFALLVASWSARPRRAPLLDRSTVRASPRRVRGSWSFASFFLSVLVLVLLLAHVRSSDASIPGAAPIRVPAPVLAEMTRSVLSASLPMRGCRRREARPRTSATRLQLTDRPVSGSGLFGRVHRERGALRPGSARCARTSGAGCGATSSRGWCSPPSSCPREWRTPSLPVCRR